MSNNNLNMIAGIHYIVTANSKYNDFRIGDHIWMGKDGAILCKEAVGFIAPEDVQETTQGMAIELDMEWALKRHAELKSQLAKIDINNLLRKNTREK